MFESYLTVETAEITSALVAIITLPLIFFTVLQTNKQQRRERESQSLQAYIEAKRYLNESFQHHAKSLKFYFEEIGLPVRSKGWDVWHDQNNIFGYIRASYLPSKYKKEAMEALSSTKNYGCTYAITQFCKDVEDFLVSLESFNSSLGKAPMESIKSHSIVRLYEDLKKVDL